MRKLFKMALDFGRMGRLEGVFVATDAEVNLLRDRRVCFGERLGKHSECTWLFDDLDEVIVPMTDDQAFVDRFVELKLATGVNPLNYLEGDS